MLESPTAYSLILSEEPDFRRKQSPPRNSVAIKDPLLAIPFHGAHSRLDDIIVWVTLIAAGYVYQIGKGHCQKFLKFLAMSYFSKEHFAGSLSKQGVRHTANSAEIGTFGRNVQGRREESD